MGFWHKINQFLKKQVAAKEISPHSWDSQKVTKQQFSKERYQAFLPLLQEYYGEENFESFERDFSREALKIEKSINFLVNDGSPLNRELSLLLSFDLSRVFEKFPLAHLDDLKTIIVYPTGLPVAENWAGVLFSQGPKKLIDYLGIFESQLEILSLMYSHNSKAPSLAMIKEQVIMKNEFDHWKKEISIGLTEKTKLKMSQYLEKLEHFYKKFYTEEALLRFQKTLAENGQADLADSMSSPDLVQTQLKTFKGQFDQAQTYDEHSLHLSWIDHIGSLADSEQNLFIHELAHYIDVKKGITLFDLDSDIWNQLLENYENGEKWMGDYATTNRKEYFAVATETFFRAPDLVKDKQPKLYKELKSVYKKVPQARPRTSYRQILSIMVKVNYYEEEVTSAA